MSFWTEDLTKPLNETMGYLRATLAANPEVGASTVINIERIDTGCLVLDLDDGQTIKLTVERYPTDPRDRDRNPDPGNLR